MTVKLWVFGLSGLATIFSANVVWRWWITGTPGALVTIVCGLVYVISAISLFFGKEQV